MKYRWTSAAVLVIGLTLAGVAGALWLRPTAFGAALPEQRPGDLSIVLVTGKPEVEITRFELSATACRYEVTDPAGRTRELVSCQPDSFMLDSLYAAVRKRPPANKVNLGTKNGACLSPSEQSGRASPRPPPRLLLRVLGEEYRHEPGPCDRHITSPRVDPAYENIVAGAMGLRSMAVQAPGVTTFAPFRMPARLADPQADLFEELDRFAPGQICFFRAGFGEAPFSGGPRLGDGVAIGYCPATTAGQQAAIERRIAAHPGFEPPLRTYECRYNVDQPRCRPEE